MKWIKKLNKEFNTYDYTLRNGGVMYFVSNMFDYWELSYCLYRPTTNSTLLGYGITHETPEIWSKEFKTASAARAYAEEIMHARAAYTSLCLKQ